jgi:hypothetical protein
MPLGEAFDAAGNARQAELMDTLRISVERARLAFEGLKEAEKSIGEVLGRKYVNDSFVSRLKKLEKPLLDSIAALKLLYMLPEDYRPYEEATVRLMDHLQTANGLIEGNEMPGENCLAALRTAQRETNRVVGRINAYMSKDYAAFLKLVLAEQIAPLKQYPSW